MPASGSPSVASLPRSSTRIQTSGVVIDEASYSAKVRGKPLDLTFKEFELLRFLATHPSRVFTREQLLSEVWGYDYFGGTRTVDVHVRRLRAKLGDLESAHRHRAQRRLPLQRARGRGTRGRRSLTCEHRLARAVASSDAVTSRLQDEPAHDVPERVILALILQTRPEPRPDPATGCRVSQRRTPWRPSGMTSGRPLCGSSMTSQRSPNTSSTISAVTTSAGSPSATMAPSFMAMRWSA